VKNTGLIAIDDFANIAGSKEPSGLTRSALRKAVIHETIE